MRTDRSRISGERLERLFRRLGPALVRSMARSFRLDAQEWKRGMADRFRAPLYIGPGNANPNKTLHNRTGALRNSLGTSVTTASDLKGTRLALFSAGVPYARVQELGGTIRSKRPGGYLTIPLEDNMTPAGVTRMSARRAIDQGARFWESAGGNVFIVDDEEGPPRKFLFLLKKQVRIRPGRLGFFKTWKNMTESRRRRQRGHVIDAIREAVQAL
ncbi:MAG TPA: hypothetical protein VM537_22710 [Anaerolineae bacterium]|nr:hypothetical protein [Anaerolineae bacterium]